MSVAVVAQRRRWSSCPQLGRIAYPGAPLARWESAPCPPPLAGRRGGRVGGAGEAQPPGHAGAQLGVDLGPVGADRALLDDALDPVAQGADNVAHQMVPLG